MQTQCVCVCVWRLYNETLGNRMEVLAARPCFTSAWALKSANAWKCPSGSLFCTYLNRISIQAFSRFPPVSSWNPPFLCTLLGEIPFCVLIFLQQLSGAAVRGGSSPCTLPCNELLRPEGGRNLIQNCCITEQHPPPPSLSDSLSLSHQCTAKVCPEIFLLNDFTQPGFIYWKECCHSESDSCIRHQGLLLSLNWIFSPASLYFSS